MDSSRNSATGRAVDAAIAALAGRQHGVVTRAQLLALGLGTNEIQYRLSVGRLHRIYDGVYAVGHRPPSPYARAMAAVLACGPGALLSHGSAAVLWGIYTRWEYPLEVTAPTRREHREIRAHRSTTLAPKDRDKQYGVPVTTPARTAYDMADRLTEAQLRRALATMRRSAYLYLPDLAALIDRHPRTRATKRLRPHVAHPDRAPTRSEFEDSFLAFAYHYGLPEPQVNVYVLGFEVDAYFPAHRLVVELDSYEFHFDREQFERDRERDAVLLQAGIATVRVTWSRLHEAGEREAGRLRTILAARGPG